jgi:hypothetical protein
MSDTVLAQLAALKAAPVAALKKKWRDLFNREPPAYNRRFLENRLAYRIQELAYGGLSEEAVERLDALADEPRVRRRNAVLRLQPADRRDPADPAVEGCRTLRHSPAGGLRISGPALQVAFSRRTPDRRHTLERPGLLRP